MPDLKFSFKTNEEEKSGDVTTYNITPNSFLYPDTDYRTNITTCHLGVIGQRWNDMDHWVLGSAFMENFYVTYDATSPEQLRVGLSYSTEEHKFSLTNVEMIIGLVLVGILVVLLTVASICCFCRARKETRLARAKTFFD